MFVTALHRREHHADWWLSGGVSGADCVFAYQPKGAADYAASLVNLHNPGVQNARARRASVAPTWDVANGWKFNGSNQYLYAGTLAPEPSNVPNCTIIAQFTNAPNASSTIVGGYELTPYSFFGLSNRELGTVRFWYGVNYRTAGAITAGNLALAGLQGYVNGVAAGSPIVSSVSQQDDIRIGMLTGRWFTLCNVQAVAYYSAILTAPQVAAVTTAMQGL